MFLFACLSHDTPYTLNQDVLLCSPVVLQNTAAPPQQPLTAHLGPGRLPPSLTGRPHPPGACPTSAAGSPRPPSHPCLPCVCCWPTGAPPATTRPLPQPPADTRPPPSLKMAEAAPGAGRPPVAAGAASYWLTRRRAPCARERGGGVGAERRQLNGRGG